MKDRWKTKRQLLAELCALREKVDSLDGARAAWLSHVERGLRVSEQRFRRVFEGGPLGLALVDREFRFLQVNPALCRILGYTEGELLHLGFADVIHPEDLATDREPVRQVLEGALPSYRRHEERYLTKDGRVVWARLYVWGVRDDAGSNLYNLAMVEDITQARQAEEALRTSEEKFARAFRSSPHAVMMTRLADGVIVDVNDAFERTFGFRRAEVIGRPAREIGAWQQRDDRVRFNELLEREGRVRNFETRIQVRSGQVRWFEISAEVIQLGGARHVISTSADVTARERTLRALRESERRYRLVSRAVFAAIWEWDLRTDLLRWSDGIRTEFGYDPSFVQPTLGWWSDRVHPEDWEQVEASLAAVVGGGATVWEAEYRFQRQDGSYAWVVDRGYIERDDEGRGIRMVGAMMDATRRKQSEEALRREHAFVRLLQVVAATANETPSVGAALRTCLDLVCSHTGWPVGHAFITDAADPDVLLPSGPWRVQNACPHDRFRIATKRRKFRRGVGLPGHVLDTGEPAWVVDVRSEKTFLRGAAAEDADLRAVFAMPVLVGDRVVAVLEFLRAEPAAPDAELLEIARYVGTQLGRMIERRRAEEALQASRGQQRALSRRLLEIQETERSAIARELHDQIGQALTAVKLNLEAASRGGADRFPDIGETLAAIDNAIDQVRTLSFELRPALLDDLGLAVAVSSYAKQQASKAGLDLRLAVDGIAARKDVETACFRILQEAITNVVRHAKARRVDVVLREEGGALELRVRDDGVGFGAPGGGAVPSDVKRLGLLGMTERAQFVGGELHIASGGGGGTLVTARFPMAAEPAARVHAHAS